MSKSFKTIYLGNAKGAALLMVLMATVALTAMVIVFQRSSHIKNRLSKRYNAENDINEAITRIVSIVMTPSSCNANFYNQPVAGGNLTAIYSCVTGNCRTAINRTIVLDATPSSWTMFRGEKPRDARIVTMSYAITTPQRTKAGTGTAEYPAELTLTINFEKKIGMNNNVQQTAKVTKTVTAYVVTNTYNYTTWSLNASPANLYGCAKTPSSTLVH